MPDSVHGKSRRIWAQSLPSLVRQINRKHVSCPCPIEIWTPTKTKSNIVFYVERVKNLQLLELGVYTCCFNCPHKVFGYYIKEHKHICPKELVIPCNFWGTSGKWVLSTCFYSMHTNGSMPKNMNFPFVILVTLYILKDLPTVHWYLWFCIHK